MTIKAEFADWKSSPVTKKVFAGLREHETILIESLVTSAGIDVKEDCFKRGYIAALRDMYQVRVEDAGEVN